MEPIDKITEESAPEVSKTDIWKRGLIMLVFIFAFGVGQSLLYLTTIAQFLWLLFGCGLGLFPGSPGARALPKPVVTFSGSILLLRRPKKVCQSQCLRV